MVSYFIKMDKKLNK